MDSGREQLRVAWATSFQNRADGRVHGRACDGFAFPQDLTDVVFEIANGRLEVKAIEDPSKVPTALREALSERQIRVELRDGTVLNGEITAGTLTFASSLGTVEVRFEDIRSYEDESARLADGSVLKGRFGDGMIEIATSRGDLRIPAQDIVNIARAKSGSPDAARQRQPAPGTGDAYRTCPGQLPEAGWQCHRADPRYVPADAYRQRRPLSVELCSGPVAGLDRGVRP